MKKVLAVFLALIVTIGLTACGQSSSPKAELNANELKIIESLNGQYFIIAELSSDG